MTSRLTDLHPYRNCKSILPTTTAEAKELIGRRIVYLRRADVDHTGRGYFFPRFGKVVGARYKTIMMDNGDSYAINSFVEMIENPDEVRNDA